MMKTVLMGAVAMALVSQAADAGASRSTSSSR